MSQQRGGSVSSKVLIPSYSAEGLIWASPDFRKVVRSNVHRLMTEFRGVKFAYAYSQVEGGPVDVMVYEDEESPGGALTAAFFEDNFKGQWNIACTNMLITQILKKSEKSKEDGNRDDGFVLRGREIKHVFVAVGPVGSKGAQKIDTQTWGQNFAPTNPKVEVVPYGVLANLRFPKPASICIVDTKRVLEELHLGHALQLPRVRPDDNDAILLGVVQGECIMYVAEACSSVRVALFSYDESLEEYGRFTSESKKKKATKEDSSSEKE